MNRIEKKIDRMASLKYVRKIQLDKELAILNELQVKKKTAKDELYESQMMYIQGVDRLNKERQSPERKMLDALERSIDLAKSRWYQKLQILRAVEEDERRQNLAVQEAHRNLKMLEKLDDRYNDQLRKHNNRVEQKILDEFAVQRRKTSDDPRE